LLHSSRFCLFQFAVPGKSCSEVKFKAGDSFRLPIVSFCFPFLTPFPHCLRCPKEHKPEMKFPYCVFAPNLLVTYFSLPASSLRPLLFVFPRSPLPPPLSLTLPRALGLSGALTYSEMVFFPSRLSPYTSRDPLIGFLGCDPLPAGLLLRLPSPRHLFF